MSDPMTPAVPDPTVEALSVAADVLPDGRVDHRGHLRDEMVGDGTSTCLDCTSDDGDDPWVTWTIPYDIDGKPMPKDWRTMRYADVLALCGMTTAAPDALRVRAEALAAEWERENRRPNGAGDQVQAGIWSATKHNVAELRALLEETR